jgi:hypothetical protein
MPETPYSNRESILRQENAGFTVSLRSLSAALPCSPLTFSHLRSYFRRDRTPLLAPRHVSPKFFCINTVLHLFRHFISLFIRIVVFSMARSTQLPKVLSFLFILKSILQRPLHSPRNPRTIRHLTIRRSTVISHNPLMHFVVNSPLLYIHTPTKYTL